MCLLNVSWIVSVVSCWNFLPTGAAWALTYLPISLLPTAEYSGKSNNAVWTANIISYKRGFVKQSNKFRFLISACPWSLKGFIETYQTWWEMLRISFFGQSENELETKVVLVILIIIWRKQNVQAPVQNLQFKWDHRRQNWLFLNHNSQYLW